MNKFLKLIFISLIVLGVFWTIKNNPLSSNVKAEGTVRPEKIVTVGATVSSLMIEVYVDEDSPVKKNQIIAKLDESIFDTDINSAKASLATAQANHIKQQAITNNNAKTYRRYKNLCERNLMARSELDLAESTYFASIAALNATLAQVQQAQAQLAKAERLKVFATILSPVDGVVIERKVNPGEPVAASYKEPELFVIATDLKKMELEIKIPASKISQVEKGQKVRYTVNGIPHKTFEGTISRIKTEPTKNQKLTDYIAIVPVDNSDLKFKYGMNVKATIFTK